MPFTISFYICNAHQVTVRISLKRLPPYPIYAHIFIIPVFANAAFIYSLLLKMAFLKQPAGGCIILQNIRINAVDSLFAKSMRNQSIYRILSIAFFSGRVHQLNVKLSLSWESMIMPKAIRGLSLSAITSYRLSGEFDIARSQFI